MRKTAHGLVTWDDVTVTLEDGRVVKGTYGYSDRFITVKTERGSKTADLGNMKPEILARFMLRELAVSLM
jgi:major membrane immunogen (membrane-anchored lipoprotein)